jgi:transposase
LTTKIHALVDALGNPANLMLATGQIHDLACAQDLIENADPEALIADKAYDAGPLINSLTEREITPAIPPQMQPKDQTRLRFRTLLRAQPHRALLQ